MCHAGDTPRLRQEKGSTLVNYHGVVCVTLATRRYTSAGGALNCLCNTPGNIPRTSRFVSCAICKTVAGRSLLDRGEGAGGTPEEQLDCCDDTRVWGQRTLSPAWVDRP